MTQEIVTNPQGTSITVVNTEQEVRVFARTQRIEVNPATQAVSLVYAGPQGPPGASGSAYYKHKQDVPDYVWTAHHNLGVRLNVSVFDSANDEIEGDVVHVDDNTTTITFAYAITGYAIFS